MRGRRGARTTLQVAQCVETGCGDSGQWYTESGQGETDSDQGRTDSGQTAVESSLGAADTDQGSSVPAQAPAHGNLPVLGLQMWKTKVSPEAAFIANTLDLAAVASP